MHFAFPPRKTSHPPPYAIRSPRSPFLRRSRLQFLVLIALAAFTTIFLLSTLFSGPSPERIPAGTPPVVVVTTIDNSQKPSYIETIKQNRRDYAAKHGYATFFPNTTDYPLDGSPTSWSKVPALRHAMTLYPYSTYYFYLSPQTLIMNQDFSIEDHIMEKSRLESLMIVDVPVVPPDSVIKTFPHLKGDRIDLVLTQDKEGLSQNSFIVRRGEWAKYFLDAWFDPLYRSYNFQKAEAHALEHLVQWHGTILAKLALVPPGTMNAHAKSGTGEAKDGVYKEGDFIAAFPDCDKSGRSCETEIAPLLHKLKGKSADDE